MLVLKYPKFPLPLLGVVLLVNKTMQQERQPEVLVIAVPNGFRDPRKSPSRHTDASILADPSRRFIEKGCGLSYQAGPDDPYYGFADGYPVEFVEMRGQDITAAVGDKQSGIHLGITGRDRYENSPESLLDLIEVVRPFPFGRCDLKLGVPTNSPTFSKDTTLEDIAGLRIATGLEVIARKILVERDIDANIIPMAGHVENAIRYNLADVIMDITETGGTMIRHGVTPAERLRSFYAVLIGKKGSLGEDIDLIKSWFLDRVDMTLANPSMWMTPRERQARTGEMYLRPMLPNFSSLSEPEDGVIIRSPVVRPQIPA